MKRVLVTVHENDVAPRFDLATEVVIATLAHDTPLDENKTLVLAHASAEDMCQLVLDEGVEAVICGGIEEEFYDYLTWKEVRVVDSVAGKWKGALEALRAATLQSGDVLFPRPGGEDHDSE